MAHAPCPAVPLQIVRPRGLASKWRQFAAGDKGDKGDMAVASCVALSSGPFVLGGAKPLNSYPARVVAERNRPRGNDTLEPNNND